MCSNERLLTCTALTEAMGNLYVFGGRCCQSFDPGTGKWKQLTPMPTECSPYQALTVRDRIYVIAKLTTPSLVAAAFLVAAASLLAAASARAQLQRCGLIHLWARGRFYLPRLPWVARRQSFHPHSGLCSL